MESNIILIYNRSEITAGTRGASLGPDAIKSAARLKGSQFFSEYKSINISDQNDLLDHPSKFQFAKRIDGLTAIYDQLTEQVAKTLKDDNFPFVIAADHGSAGGTVAGIAAAYPSSRIGVIWIDAHADIHSPFTTPSGNIHGMPVATFMDVDNKEVGENEPDQETIEYWNRLKNYGKQGRKVQPDDFTYIAVRDTEPEEEHIMQQLQLRNILVKEVRERGIENILEELNQRLKDCDKIYVSFDVDSMDPDLTSYGTGTPVKNGLTVEEAAGILEGLASDKRTCCIELVEVNPCLDEKKNKMAEVAFELIGRITEVIKNRK